MPNVPTLSYRSCFSSHRNVCVCTHVEPSHRIEIASQSLMFDGDKTWHASEYFGGRRWSFVFFNMKHGAKTTKANATIDIRSTINATTKGREV
jgi:hypothetical protein